MCLATPIVICPFTLTCPGCTWCDHQHVHLPLLVSGCPQTSCGYTWCDHQLVPCPFTLTSRGMSPDILWIYLVRSPTCPMSVYPHMSRDVPRHPMVPGAITNLSHVRLSSHVPGYPQTTCGYTWCDHQLVPCPFTLTCPGMSPDIPWYLHGAITNLSYVHLSSHVPGYPQTTCGYTWCDHQLVPCPFTLTCPGISPDNLWIYMSDHQ